MGVSPYFTFGLRSQNVASRLDSWSESMGLISPSSSSRVQFHSPQDHPMGMITIVWRLGGIDLKRGEKLLRRGLLRLMPDGFACLN